MCLVCGKSLPYFVLLIDGVVQSFHGFQKEYTTTDSKQCCYKMIAKLQQQEKEYLHYILASHARKDHIDKNEDCITKSQAHINKNKDQIDKNKDSIEEH